MNKWHSHHSTSFLVHQLLFVDMWRDQLHDLPSTCPIQFEIWLFLDCISPTIDLFCGKYPMMIIDLRDQSTKTYRRVYFDVTTQKVFCLGITFHFVLISIFQCLKQNERHNLCCRHVCMHLITSCSRRMSCSAM
jgi:hypothetical protein